MNFFIKTVITFLFLCPFLAFSQARSYKEAIENEYYETIVAQTNEHIDSYIKNKTIYQNNSKNYLFYKQVMNDLCVEYKVNCMPIYLTKNVVDNAAMYPNKVLVINENVFNKLNKNEVIAILSHEFGHYYLNHSAVKSKEVANSIVDNGIMFLDIERIVYSVGFLPGMKDVLYKIEDEADEFSINYLKEKNIKINCNVMFKKIIGNKVASVEKHKATSERCKNY